KQLEKLEKNGIDINAIINSVNTKISPTASPTLNNPSVSKELPPESPLPLISQKTSKPTSAEIISKSKPIQFGSEIISAIMAEASNRTNPDLVNDDKKLRIIAIETFLNQYDQLSLSDFEAPVGIDQLKFNWKEIKNDLYDSIDLIIQRIVKEKIDTSYEENYMENIAYIKSQLITVAEEKVAAGQEDEAERINAVNAIDVNSIKAGLLGNKNKLIIESKENAETSSETKPQQIDDVPSKTKSAIYLAELLAELERSNEPDKVENENEDENIDNGIDELDQFSMDEIERELESMEKEKQLAIEKEKQLLQNSEEKKPEKTIKMKRQRAPSPPLKAPDALKTNKPQTITTSPNVDLTLPQQQDLDEKRSRNDLFMAGLDEIAEINNPSSLLTPPQAAVKKNSATSSMLNPIDALRTSSLGKSVEKFGEFFEKNKKAPKEKEGMRSPKDMINLLMREASEGTNHELLIDDGENGINTKKRKIIEIQNFLDEITKLKLSGKVAPEITNAINAVSHQWETQIKKGEPVQNVINSITNKINKAEIGTEIIRIKMELLKLIHPDYQKIDNDTKGKLGKFLLIQNRTIKDRIQETLNNLYKNLNNEIDDKIEFYFKRYNQLNEIEKGHEKDRQEDFILTKLAELAELKDLSKTLSKDRFANLNEIKRQYENIIKDESSGSFEKDSLFHEIAMSMKYYESITEALKREMLKDNNLLRKYSGIEVKDPEVAKLIEEVKQALPEKKKLMQAYTASRSDLYVLKIQLQNNNIHISKAKKTFASIILNDHSLEIANFIATIKKYSPENANLKILENRYNELLNKMLDTSMNRNQAIEELKELKAACLEEEIATWKDNCSNILLKLIKINMADVMLSAEDRAMEIVTHEDSNTSSAGGACLALEDSIISLTNFVRNISPEMDVESLDAFLSKKDQIPIEAEDKSRKSIVDLKGINSNLDATIAEKIKHFDSNQIQDAVNDELLRMEHGIISNNGFSNKGDQLFLLLNDIPGKSLREVMDEKTESLLTKANTDIAEYYKDIFKRYSATQTELANLILKPELTDKEREKLPDLNKLLTALDKKIREIWPKYETTLDKIPKYDASLEQTISEQGKENKIYVEVTTAAMTTINKMKNKYSYGYDLLLADFIDTYNKNKKEFYSLITANDKDYKSYELAKQKCEQIYQIHDELQKLIKDIAAESHKTKLEPIKKHFNQLNKIAQKFVDEQVAIGITRINEDLNWTDCELRCTKLLKQVEEFENSVKNYAANPYNLPHTAYTAGRLQVDLNAFKNQLDAVQKKGVFDFSLIDIFTKLKQPFIENLEPTLIEQNNKQKAMLKERYEKLKIAIQPALQRALEIKDGLSVLYKRSIYSLNGDIPWVEKLYPNDKERENYKKLQAAESFLHKTENAFSIVENNFDGLKKLMPLVAKFIASVPQYFFDPNELEPYYQENLMLLYSDYHNKITIADPAEVKKYKDEVEAAKAANDTQRLNVSKHKLKAVVKAGMTAAGPEFMQKDLVTPLRTQLQTAILNYMDQIIINQNIEQATQFFPIIYDVKNNRIRDEYADLFIDNPEFNQSKDDIIKLCPAIQYQFLLNDLDDSIREQEIKLEKLMNRLQKNDLSRANNFSDFRKAHENFVKTHHANLENIETP
ncbi:MAG: hypothetical protein JO149_04410, partial [Gammaproteobacteria bacterium]|nr:hypothetical protein [Gammaproteobacteria bacterium]